MSDPVPSKYNQSSFIGGMNLLGDDSRLQPNQYRIGFDLTNRYDELDPVLQSSKDPSIPVGLKQEMVTFGNYIIVFIAGFAYYRYYTSTGWTMIDGFKMSTTAIRFWTCAIPVAVTNYARIAATISTSDNRANPAGIVNVASISGAAQGNLPGLLVQDNINQPTFIFIGPTGIPVSRVTQSFTQWSITYTDANNTTVATVDNIPQDFREYVPIGNSMTWNNGKLFIASQDGTVIYQSVSGRPLDFVIAISNILATNITTQSWTYTDPISGKSTVVSVPKFTQSGGGSFDNASNFNAGGDATTTAYSVGVAGIVCLRQMSSGGIFVAAGNACFAVTQNMTPNAPTLFGEYTFIRTFLFNSVCLSDRAIFDTLGDTRFIALTGVRSFNAIEQTQNEGRNTPFTSTVAAAFTSIIQDANFACGILFDDYELYFVNTIFGFAIAKFDTINQCWTSFDISQTGGKRVKIVAKIELTIQRLYAITEDDELYTLYIGPEDAIASVRTVGICANMLYANYNIKMNNPDTEIKLSNFRCIVNKIVGNGIVTFTPLVDNNLTGQSAITKNIIYTPPDNPYVNPTNLPDINTTLRNLLFSLPNTGQGWKVAGILTWTTGVITQYSAELVNNTPTNPLNSQVTTT
jgi:hypothetical protein